MNVIQKYIKGDRVIWMVAFLLALLSVLAVYSSIITLAYKHADGNTTKYLFKHVFILISGFFLMYYAHNLKFKYYSRISQLAIWVAALMLLLTLLFGVNRNDASRWFLIPVINQEFQPSDFAKLALVLYVGRMLAVKQSVIHDFKQGVLPIIIPVAIVCGLILPANFSTAAALFTTCLVMLFVGRVAFKHIAGVVGMAVGGFLLLILLSFAAPNVLPRLETWKSRLMNYQDTEATAESAQKDFQAEEAKIAIATGGWWGKGFNNGYSRSTLPHPYSDMIYPYMIQVGGSVLAGVGILLLYLILLFRVIKIAGRCEKNFGSFITIGLGFSLVLQAMINMAVGSTLFPVTGQPLPLVSMGGTSIWFTCISIGIILSVSRSVFTENETEEEPTTNNKRKEVKDYAVA